MLSRCYRPTIRNAERPIPTGRPKLQLPTLYPISEYGLAGPSQTSGLRSMLGLLALGDSRSTIGLSSHTNDLRVPSTDPSGAESVAKLRFSSRCREKRQNIECSDCRNWLRPSIDRSKCSNANLWDYQTKFHPPKSFRLFLSPRWAANCTAEEAMRQILLGPSLSSCPQQPPSRTGAVWHGPRTMTDRTSARQLRLSSRNCKDRIQNLRGPNLWMQPATMSIRLGWPRTRC